MMAAMAPAHDEPSSAPVRTDLATAYREHYRSLVRLASLLVDDVGRCEEIVQDAFVKVWRRPPTLSGRRPAARLPAQRRAQRRALPPPPPRRRATPPPGGRLALGSARGPRLASDDDRVLAALRSLPARQREVLALRYYLDLSEAEIAATLGISAGSVKTHAHRGLATLAERLEDLR